MIKVHENQVFYSHCRIWVRENQEGNKKISFKSRVFDFPFSVLASNERIKICLVDRVVLVRSKYLFNLISGNTNLRGVDVVSVNESCIREFEII